MNVVFIFPMAVSQTAVKLKRYEANKYTANIFKHNKNTHKTIEQEHATFRCRAANAKAQKSERSRNGRKKMRTNAADEKELFNGQDFRLMKIIYYEIPFN